MVRLGITGCRGLLGWHLRSYLHHKENFQIIPADRTTFETREGIESFVSQSDVIVHFAAMNRGEDAKILETNLHLTDTLISACEKTGRTPFILFASTYHLFKTTAYAYSKKISSEHLKAWAQRSGGKFCNLVLPNIFGECGRPFYNSVVSTFCHQVANGEKPEILIDQEIDLMHALRLAAKIEEVILSGQTGDVLIKGTPIGVTPLLSKIRSFADSYKQGIVPCLQEPFDLDLFNTYRSYLFPSQYPFQTELKKNSQGFLYEAEKNRNGGQTFISHILPGTTFGNHYHQHQIERIMVLSGKADIRIRRLFSNQVEFFSVNGDEPKYIDLPALHTYDISNTGKCDLITLFWSNEILGPEKADTYPEKV